MIIVSKIPRLRVLWGPDLKQKEIEKRIMKLKRLEGEPTGTNPAGPESVDGFDILSETSESAVFICRDENFRYVNRMFEFLTGYTHKELMLMKFREIMHPEFRELIKKFSRPREEDEPGSLRYEAKIVRKKGEERWVEFVGRTSEHEGKPVVMGRAFDITERKQTEKALKQYAQRLKILSEVNAAILSGKPPEEIAEMVLGQMQEMVPFRQANIVRLDLQARNAVLLASYVNGKACRGTGEPIPLKALEDIEDLKNGQVQMIDDVQTVSRHPLGIQALMPEWVRSYISVPLTSQRELIGLLDLGAERPGAFSSEHVEIAREAASSLAVAIQQSLLKLVNCHRKGPDAQFVRLDRESEFRGWMSTLSARGGR